MNNSNTKQIPILMTLGKGNYSKTPLNNLAFPYGSLARSRYRVKYCTKQSFNEFFKNYSGEGYYFHKIVKNGKNYLIPLRKIYIVASETHEDRALIQYNVLDYVFFSSEEGKKQIEEIFNKQLENESEKADNLLTFLISKKEVHSFLNNGTNIDSWKKVIDQYKKIIPLVTVWDLSSEIPFFICTIIQEIEKDSLILDYDDNGITIKSGKNYKIINYLDMLDGDYSFQKVETNLYVDENIIQSIGNKTEFVSSYDRSELFFFTKDLTQSTKSVLKISFSLADHRYLAPDITFNINIKRIVSKRQWLSVLSILITNLIIIGSDYLDIQSKILLSAISVILALYFK